MAVMPCTPQAAKAFRSAWMPAPPPESDPAIVRTAGTRVMEHKVGAGRRGRGRAGRRARARRSRRSPCRARSRPGRARPASRGRRRSRRAPAGRRRRARRSGSTTGRLPTPPSRSRTSSGPRTTWAPSASSALGPAASGAVTRPGTAPTSRPRSSAKAAVISEPDRTPASTTTTTSARPAISRLRAGKVQRRARIPGGNSETTAPRGDDAVVQRPPRRGIGAVGPGAEDGDRAAVGLERAGVGGGVDPERQPGDHRDPGGRQPAPERAGDLEPVGRSAAGADDRHARSLEQRLQAEAIAGRVQDGGLVGQRLERRVG